MELIDSHSHIYLSEFDEDRKEIINNAVENGISTILLPNIDSLSYQAMMDTVKAYPDLCKPMIGLHPTSVKANFRDELEFVKSKLNTENYIAIGEIGIDLYWDKTYVNEQIEAFSKQIEWAIEKDLPIVIHSRESFSEIFHVLYKYKEKAVKGVFHSFTGTPELALEAIELGYYIGINGIVTFKNSDLYKVVEKVDLNHLLIETDSPYLAPVPKRGKRNESAYVKYVAEKIALIKNVSVDEVAKKTSINAKKLFNLN